MDFGLVSGIETKCAIDPGFDIRCLVLVGTWNMCHGSGNKAAPTRTVGSATRVTALMSHDLEELTTHALYLPLPSAAVGHASLTNRPRHAFEIGSSLPSAPLTLSRSVALCKAIPRCTCEVRAMSRSGARR
jgi:hypothetical protein